MLSLLISKRVLYCYWVTRIPQRERLVFSKHRGQNKSVTMLESRQEDYNIPVRQIRIPPNGKVIKLERQGLEYSRRRGQNTILERQRYNTPDREVRILQTARLEYSRAREVRILQTDRLEYSHRERLKYSRRRCQKTPDGKVRIFKRENMLKYSTQ